MYAKVFHQIFDSSIADNYKLRHFFMDLLVLADVNGVVDMTPTAISSRTRIPIEEVKTYLRALEQPDPESRTKEHQGRRIALVDDHRTWGWLIINYPRFRELASEEQRRAKTRDRVRRFRSKPESVTLGNAGVTLSNDLPSASASYSASQPGDRGLEKGEKFNPIIKLRDDVAKLFHRNQNDRWNYAEESYLCEVARRPDALTEFSTIADYYAKPDSFPRQSIESLLEHWSGELDKARNYKNGSRTNENGPRHNPRNDHIVRGPTNYGEAALRIAARPPKQVD